MKTTQIRDDETHTEEAVSGGARRPGVRLLIMLAVFVPVYALAGSLVEAVAGHALPSLVVGAAGGLGALALYSGLVRWLEKRPVDELSGRRALVPWTGLGLAWFGVTIGIIAVLGGVGAVHGGSFGAFVATLGTMLFAAAAEEVLFRGIVFRLVEEMLGARWALGVSAALFGGLHLLNPHATLWGAMAIALEAGLTTGAAYLATRSLWPVIGLHLGWNLAEGGVLGTTVSGSDAGSTGLLHTVLHGPAAISGGGFGPEASAVAVVVSLVPLIWFLRRAH